MDMCGASRETAVKAYEQLHLKRIVALLETKFPQIPRDVLSHVAYFWAHVGDY